MYKMYKVIIIDKDNTLRCPRQYTKHEVGKKYVREEMYRATGIDGLPYAWHAWPEYRVYEVEVGGKCIERNQYDRQYSELTLLREVEREELRALARAWEQRVGYKLESVLFPVSPYAVKRGSPTSAEIALLRHWAIVRDTARYTIKNGVPHNVWDHVWECVWGSRRRNMIRRAKDSICGNVRGDVYDSVLRSVQDCCAAYVFSLFFSENPLRPGADLWRAGLVPVYYNGTWCLCSGDFTYADEVRPIEYEYRDNEHMWYFT